MTRIAGASVLFAVLTLTGACGVGDDDSMMPGGGSGTPIPPIDNSEVCNAAFTVTGTFTPGTTPRPIDPETNLPITGCWAVGTWNFTATVASNMCATAPTVLPSYSFKVERVPVDPTNTDPNADTMQKLTILTTLVGGMQSHLAVSSNGQGCVGSLEFGSADGTQYWNMKPTLSKDPAATALAGGGDYTLYKGNAWPWK